MILDGFKFLFDIVFYAYKKYNKKEAEKREYEKLQRSANNKLFEIAKMQLYNSNNATVNIGIQTLHNLAINDAKLRPEVHRILCGFVRATTRTKEYIELHTNNHSEAILTIIDILCRRESDYRIYNGLQIDFSRAHLPNVNISGGCLAKAILAGANLEKANLNNIDARGCNFESANLSEVNMDDANLADTAFTNANMSNTQLFRARFLNANLDNANLQGSNLYSADFTGASLYRTNLKKANLEHTSFIAAYLEGALIEEQYLSSSNFSGSHNLSCLSCLTFEEKLANLVNKNPSDSPYYNFFPFPFNTLLNFYRYTEESCDGLRRFYNRLRPCSK